MPPLGSNLQKITQATLLYDIEVDTRCVFLFLCFLQEADDDADAPRVVRVPPGRRGAGPGGFGLPFGARRSALKPDRRGATPARNGDRFRELSSAAVTLSHRLKRTLFQKKKNPSIRRR